MRIVVPSRFGESMTRELRKSGTHFRVQKFLSSRTFVGYSVEGSLEEIEEKLKALKGVSRKELMEGFEAFKKTFKRIKEKLETDEADLRDLMGNDPMTAEILDQLLKAGLIEVKNGKVIKKAELDSISLSFKFPVDVVTNPERLSGVKEFVAVDVLVDYQFDIDELDYEGIRTAIEIISKYVSGKEALGLYFSLLARALLARELLRSLGKQKIEVEKLLHSFAKALPMVVSIEHGDMVIDATLEALEELLSLLKRLGYVEIKAGKVRKLKDVQT